MNCTICNDTGKRAGSDYLDCGHCGAAAERFVLNDFVSGVRQHNFTSFADLHWHIHQRARQIEHQEQAARIADLERQIEGCRAQILKDTATINNLNEARLLSAAPSAPAVEQQPNKTLLTVANDVRWACMKLYSPDDTATDWTDKMAALDIRAIVEKVQAAAPKAADTDKVREALDGLHNDIMNIPVSLDLRIPSDASQMLAYKMGHRDARHAAAELVASMTKEAA